MDTQELLERLRSSASVGTVFAEPYEKDGVTVIPAAKVAGGGGGGGDDAGGSGAGYGVIARPVGAYVIRNGEVAWHPALDLNRVILRSQAFVLMTLLIAWKAAKERAKRR